MAETQTCLPAPKAGNWDFQQPIQPDEIEFKDLGNTSPKSTKSKEQDHASDPDRVGLQEQRLVQQRWNEPRINLFRVLAACYGLLIMGMNDAQYGV
jgi:hypothetical protein